MSAPVEIHIKQIQHWQNPPICEYRTVDDAGEAVVDGETLDLPNFFTDSGQQTVDKVHADAVAKGLLPAGG